MAPRHALATLRHRDFRLLWLGQLVSTTGDQMQHVAIAWHLYLLTDSPLQVGLLGLFRAVPFLVLSLAGGAVADIVSRQRILVISQGAMMILAGLLVHTTASGTIAPWHIYLVVLCYGAAVAFNDPARQALIPNVVPRQELPNALTLFTLLRQTATIIGPGIGGVVIGLAGLAPVYLANAASSLAVVAAVLAMRTTPPASRQPALTWQAVLGGLQYARAEPLVLAVMVCDFLASCLGSVNALLPIYARDVLRVGPEGLGLLYAANSAGAVTGATILGAVGAVPRPVFWMLAALVGQGLFVAGFGLATTFPAALAALFGRGVANVVGEVQRATIVQLKTPDEVRGRITALNMLFTQGGPQLGQLQSGAVASLLGPHPAAVIGGVGVVALILASARLPILRRWLPVSRLA